MYLLAFQASDADVVHQLVRKENKDDELKLLRDEIKGLKDIVRAQSLLSAETTASNTVSTDNDKAIASIISPETFRNERK